MTYVASQINIGAYIHFCQISKIVFLDIQTNYFRYPEELLWICENLDI